MADGKAYVDLGKEPQFTVTANGAQVRLTTWGENVNAGRHARRSAGSACRRRWRCFPNRRSPASVDVNLPAVVAGDTTIRDVALSAAPALDGWYLRSAVRHVAGPLHARGERVCSPPARRRASTARCCWRSSSRPVSPPGCRRMSTRRSGGCRPPASMRRSISTRRANRSADGDHPRRGEVDRRDRAHCPSQRQAGAGGKLQGGALDVETGSALASLFVSDTGAFRYMGHDLDLEAQSRAGRGCRTDGRCGGHVALRVKDDRLDIDRLSIVDLAGASLSAHRLGARADRRADRRHRRHGRRRRSEPLAATSRAQLSRQAAVARDLQRPRGRLSRPAQGCAAGCRRQRRRWGDGTQRSTSPSAPRATAGGSEFSATAVGKLQGRAFAGRAA